MTYNRSNNRNPLRSTPAPAVQQDAKQPCIECGEILPVNNEGEFGLARVRLISLITEQKVQRMLARVQERNPKKPPYLCDSCLAEMLEL